MNVRLIIDYDNYSTWTSCYSVKNRQCFSVVLSDANKLKPSYVLLSGWTWRVNVQKACTLLSYPWMWQWKYGQYVARALSRLFRIVFYGFNQLTAVPHSVSDMRFTLRGSSMATREPSLGCLPWSSLFFMMASWQLLLLLWRNKGKIVSGPIVLLNSVPADKFI